MLIKRRVRRLAVLLIALFLLPVGQLWYYQVLMADRLTARRENTRTAEDMRLRGSILDRRGVPLAFTRIDLRGDWTRVYPLGEAGGPLLGYLSHRLGAAGLESAVGSALAGRPRPRSLDEIRRLQREGDRRGDDVVLTLDSELQRTVYALLQGHRGAAVVLAVDSGEVLAAVSRPAFDPAGVDANWDRLRVDKTSPLVDRATQGLYPPGSSFKLLTMSAALDQGETTPDEVFACNGGLVVQGFVQHDDGYAVHGQIGLEDALVRSCNYTFGTLGLRLGLHGLKAWMGKFGMLEGPRLVPLASGARPARGRPGAEQVAAAQAGIGQADLLVTPLSMARLAAVMGRKGRDLEPRLVKAYSRRGRVVSTPEAAVARAVVSPATAATVLQAMRAVVERGSGRAAALEQASVAGKTGTAENPHGPPHAWFVGVAPAERPRVAVAVVLENTGYGGQYAAPMAREILREALKRAP